MGKKPANVVYEIDAGMKELPIWTCDNEGCDEQIFPNGSFAATIEIWSGDMKIECLNCKGIDEKRDEEIGEEDENLSSFEGLMDEIFEESEINDYDEMESFE